MLIERRDIFHMCVVATTIQRAESRRISRKQPNFMCPPNKAAKTSKEYVMKTVCKKKIPRLNFKKGLDIFF